MDERFTIVGGGHDLKLLTLGEFARDRDEPLAAIKRYSAAPVAMRICANSSGDPTNKSGGYCLYCSIWL